MSEDFLSIVTTLLNRIEQLEARLAAVEEPISVIATLDNVVKADTVKAYRIVGGLIAYNRQRKQ